MKYEAITRRELPRLIRQVRAAGRFAGTRGGHAVAISHDQTLIGSPITYAVCIGRHWTRGQAETIGAAVERINQLCRGRI